MKNLFNDISQDEKNRILEMHSGKKNVLLEDSEPTTNVMGTKNWKSKFGVKYTHTIPGDLTYVYGKCNGKWFAHNLKTTKEWDLSSNTKWKNSVDDLNKKFPKAANGCISGGDSIDNSKVSIDCLIKAGFKLTNVGGPMVRYQVYSGVIDGKNHQFTEKGYVRIFGKNIEQRGEWICDSKSPNGIKIFNIKDSGPQTLN